MSTQNIEWWGVIEKDGRNYRITLRNSLGGAFGGHVAHSLEWAFYHLMSKNHVSESSQPQSFIVNGKKITREEAIKKIKKPYILANI